MNTVRSILSSGVAATTLAASLVPVSAQTAPATPLPRLKIALVGDSTVAQSSGWGPAFARLVQPHAEVTNFAMGGRSSKSFINEGHWAKALAYKADYILIQFGHNDQPGKGPERETDPESTYPQFLRRYILESRAQGAKPILVTSVARRNFKDGKVADSLGPYADAAKKVAAQEKVPLVDLHARSIEQLNAMGQQAADEYNPPSQDPAKPDRTHFSAKGGAETALLVAGEVKRVVPELKPYFATVLGVAADGSREYKTIQEAIAAVPDNSTNRVLIRVKAGKYQGPWLLAKNKANIVLEGEDAATTILTWNQNVNDPNPAGFHKFNPGIQVEANDFRATNLTIENTAGDRGQALAVMANGDRAVFENCRMLGWQDTLMVNNGRHYFKNCYIEGRVDFIYGSGTAVFDTCHIHSKNGGYITAANTPQEKPYGLVFLNCKLTGDPNPWVDPATGQPSPKARPGALTYLGRPWRSYANVAFINSQMGDHIRPEGWHNWGKVENEQTARYFEFGSRALDQTQADGTVVAGQTLDLATRVGWAKKLTPEEAALYTVDNILKGTDNWNPLTGTFTAPILTPVVLQMAPPAAVTTTGPRGKVRIVLAGDSTVTDDAGWGAGLKANLKPEVELINLSKGGRSSGSFVAEGRWKQSLELKPDYVLIQFGHNDQPGHGPERETDPKTTYRVNMERYVDEARAAGITPILVTSLSRRQWGEGDKINSSLSPYAEAVQQIAKEKKVALIDLHALSITQYEKMGREGVKEISPPKPGGLDGTHLNAKGGEIFGRIMAEALKQSVPPLASEVKLP